MPLVVGVNFRKSGKAYYFDPAGIALSEGDPVIAETARGIEFGEVTIAPKDVLEEEIVSPLKKIIRKATQADIERAESYHSKEKQAFSICLQKVQQHNLQMKLIDAEYCFDGSQVTFYFSAESRVDFRELVKDLAGALRTKVQLHQVGVRDEAKLFGGMGPCGRQMCCTTFLNGFEPVSMKMAKEQCLFLNPLKFSGVCGKLMCCLKYEYPMYKEAKEKFPAINSMVDTKEGCGKVVELNIIKETYSVQLESGSVLHLSIHPEADEPCGCPAKDECARYNQTRLAEAPQAKQPERINGGKPFPVRPVKAEAEPQKPAEPSKPENPAGAEQPAGNGGSHRRRNRRRKPKQQKSE
ncbi:MAG TPA: stage 0 sporulation protein [Armatimonadetes bacterium]|nr:stage 0 sporulation protein [Armatimonadota bacterium]